MGGRSPRRRAQQPAPVVPLKWTSAGVHAVAARPRAAMRGPARPVIHVEIGHFSTSIHRSEKSDLHRADELVLACVGAREIEEC